MPLRTKASGDAVLRYEDGMMMFASDNDFRFLAQSGHWFGDRTSKVTPVGCNQQYSLHAFHSGVTYPYVFALLPEKTELTYRKMLGKICQLIPSDTPLNPASLMTNFQKATINAFTYSFRAAETACYYFHLEQSARRRIQSLGRRSVQKET